MMIVTMTFQSHAIADGSHQRVPRAGAQHLKPKVEQENQRYGSDLQLLAVDHDDQYQR
jgi:hypothetical protein